MNVFIERPVATTLLMLAILLFGVLGYRQLPVSDLPSVDFPTIQVRAALPGASPETMAAAVATPLEKQFSTIAGLDSMTSTSGLGTTQIALQFALDRDIDAAAQDVQAAIGAVQRNLPRDMPTPPSFQKVNPADQPILILTLSSPTLPLSTLNEYGETLIAPRVATISGVAQVMFFSPQKYAVRVQLDPRELARRKLGLETVLAAIADNNVTQPNGTLWGADTALNLQANGQLGDAAGFRPIVVAYKNGAPVRLAELGRVIDGVESDRTASYYISPAEGTHTRAIVMAVQRQPGSNTVAVAQAVRALLPTIESQLPAAARLRVLIDRSEPIEESVQDVQFTLLLTLALVVLVIFLFLRNVSATLIPSLALPLSVVGTFAVMALLGFSLDNLSLMALTLSVGFVVDDAVVMLENIVRHLEMGKPAPQAARDGAKEIGFTIVSMTLSLAAVFIPLLFMGGLVGRLFHEFAITIGAAILVSGFVSLSLTPMLCSRFLRPSREARHGWFYRITERGYLATLRVYEVTLRWAMRWRIVTVVFSLGILWGTVELLRVVPKGFLPSEDRDSLSATTDAAEGTSFENLLAHQQAAAAVVARHPGVEAFISTVGGQNWVSNQGRMFLRLRPRGARTETADQIVESLRPALAQIPGLRVFVMNPPPINIGARFATALYQFTVQSPDLPALIEHAPRLLAALRARPELQDVNSDLRIASPEIEVQVDRDRAAAYGLSVRTVEDALYSAYSSRQVSTILAPNNQYAVLLELLPEYQRDPSALDLLYLRNAAGQPVPLTAVARFAPGVGPLTVNHSGQLPSVTFSFNPKPDVSLDQALGAVEAAARDVLPAGITTTFSGTAQAFQDSLAGLGWLLLLAVLVIYLILGILYESFIHPITILTGLPFAGFGALLTLYLFKADLNLYSYVGLIMLIGVVKKNAIMMVDFAIAAEREGKPPAAAIVEACLVRFRPIMMTTMAAFMGTLPIAIGLGAGAEARRPLGLAVVGGLVVSQLVTLYVTPVFYTYFEGLSRAFGRLGRRAKRPEGAAQA